VRPTIQIFSCVSHDVKSPYHLSIIFSSVLIGWGHTTWPVNHLRPRSRRRHRTGPVEHSMFDWARSVTIDGSCSMVVWLFSVNINQLPICKFRNLCPKASKNFVSVLLCKNILLNVQNETYCVCTFIIYLQWFNNKRWAISLRLLWSLSWPTCNALLYSKR